MDIPVANSDPFSKKSARVNVSLWMGRLELKKFLTALLLKRPDEIFCKVERQIIAVPL